MGTTYEIWDETGLVKECYSYSEFKKEFLKLRDKQELRAYSICLNPKHNKYYRIKNSKLYSETNYYDN